MRLDLCLAGKIGMKSRSEARRLIEDGKVTVNGKIVKKPSQTVQSSDTVQWKEERAIAETATAYSGKVPEVLYEDDDCMVIDKPAGLAVHPGSGMKKGEATLLDALRTMFAKRKIPFSASTVLVHRLDKETTGCLLIAKNPKAHQTLQKQFETRTVEKVYLALVAGVPSPAAAVIDAPIGRHTGDRTKMSIVQTGRTRTAQTTYRTLGKAKGAALLSCELHTGRTHQIRVHLRGIDHPILGDEKYATAKSEQLAALLGIDFLCLHAWKLAFTSGKKKVSVEAELSKNFGATLKKLGMKL